MTLRTKLIAAVIFAAGMIAPSAALSQPAGNYCHCIAACGAQYDPGSSDYDWCVGICAYNHMIMVCDPASPDKMVADRR